MTNEHGRPVLQKWVWGLPFMQQTVLLTAIRGPDGLHKRHISKDILHFYRRCILVAADTGGILDTPHKPGGGEFMAPAPSGVTVLRLFERYLESLDEVPHHFQLHFMHGAEILGYKHPDRDTRDFWLWAYHCICDDMHLGPETLDQMNKRMSQ